MLDEIFTEIKELQEFKKKYEYLIKEKKLISEELYHLMMGLYSQKSFSERSEEYKNDTCKDCRGRDYCPKDLPKNIGEPIRSDKDWIPATTSCGNFKWS